MTTLTANTGNSTRSGRCGCCGREVPAGHLVKLGSTPGVFICDRCALWAVRRSTGMPVVRLDPRVALKWLRTRVRPAGPAGPAGPAVRTIPILPSTDLDRTAAFYRSAGMKELARYEGYLLMGLQGVELHFTIDPDAAGRGQAIVLLPDAGRRWKQLKSQHVPGLGPVEDREHGLREFVITDPDGNRIRLASPIQD